MFGKQQKKSFFNQLSGIASIISAAIVCIRLAYLGILPIQYAALIMITVVVFAALGNVFTKLALSGIAIWLFCKLVSGGNEAQFQAAVGAILALIIALLGLYVMIRGVFGKTRKG